jgi:RND superfamily putative drug exporter
VPAVMTLLGRWNWYLPKWLNWLPDLRMEAGVSRPEPVAAGDSEEVGGSGA